MILYLPFAAIVWYNKLIALMQIKSPRTYTEQILAYDTDTSYIVCVKDNGIGFDPDKELDGMTHIGTHNIRERLSAICSALSPLKAPPEQVPPQPFSFQSRGRYDSASAFSAAM